MKERDGKIVVKHVANAKKDTLTKEIIENVEEESEIYTDDFKSYHYLYSIYKHITVNRSKGEYIKLDDVHTNGIESFWSMLKRDFKECIIK